MPQEPLYPILLEYTLAADIPVISIVIAAFNAQETIKRCLESCKQQTFEHFEVVFVDDGATDQTAHHAQVYANQDHRFRIIRISNVGQGAARNLGIRAAVGDYITVLDADDTLDPTALETLVMAAKAHDADLVIANWRRLEAQAGKMHETPIFPSNLQGVITKAQKSYAIARTYFSVAKLYRKSMLLQYDIRYGEGYIYEDMEFVLGAVLRSKQTVVVKSALYTVHVNPTSSTRKHTQDGWHAWSFEKAVQATLEKYQEQLLPYRKQYTFYVLNRAYIYAMQEKRVPKQLWRSFVFNILGMISCLHSDAPNVDTASRRYAPVLRLWALNNTAGYLGFRVATFLARLTLRRAQDS